LLSSEAQNRCRRLDVVTVKGSEVPIGIYTYDALQEQEFRGSNENKKVKRNSTGQSKKADDGLALTGQQVAADILERNNGNGGGEGKGGRGSNSPSPHTSGNSSPARRPSLTLAPGTASAAQQVLFLTPDDETGDVFERDYDLLKLRQHVTSDFLDCFKEGIGLYLGGDWEQAKVLLERADSMMLELAPALGGDGPSKTLLRYMAAEGFKSPASWKGYRPLTSK